MGRSEPSAESSVDAGFHVNETQDYGEFDVLAGVLATAAEPAPTLTPQEVETAVHAAAEEMDDARIAQLPFFKFAQFRTLMRDSEDIAREWNETAKTVVYVTSGGRNIELRKGFHDGSFTGYCAALHQVHDPPSPGKWDSWTKEGKRWILEATTPAQVAKGQGGRIVKLCKDEELVWADDVKLLGLAFDKGDVVTLAAARLRLHHCAVV